MTTQTNPSTPFQTRHMHQTKWGKQIFHQNDVENTEVRIWRTAFNKKINHSADAEGDNMVNRL